MLGERRETETCSRSRNAWIYCIVVHILINFISSSSSFAPCQTCPSSSTTLWTRHWLCLSLLFSRDISGQPVKQGCTPAHPSSSKVKDISSNYIVIPSAWLLFLELVHSASPACFRSLRCMGPLWLQTEGFYTRSYVQEIAQRPQIFYHSWCRAGLTTSHCACFRNAVHRTLEIENLLKLWFLGLLRQAWTSCALWYGPLWRWPQISVFCQMGSCHHLWSSGWCPQADRSRFRKSKSINPTYFQIRVFF